MNNISLKAKILFLSLFMVGAAATVGTVSYVFAKKTNHALKAMVEGDLPAIHAVNEMLLSFRLARIEILQLNAEGTTPESDALSMKSIEQEWKHFDEQNKIYLETSTNAPDEEKKLYAEYMKELQVVRDQFKKAIELYKKNPSEDSPERKEMAKLVANDIAAQSIKVREASEKIGILQDAQVKDSTEHAIQAADTGSIVCILVTLIGSLLGMSAAFIFSTRLSRQLNHVIESIANSSREVAAASTQIADSSVKLSEASTEQASSLGETAASLEEITAMIAKASESATSTEKRSAESQSKAQEGRHAVDQMLSSIEEISRSNNEIVTQVNSSNQQMSEIVRVIQEIGTKTKVINEIVFQTKLLSFNASVEAARAGEHGKGFAVVAEEVGNLAQMSGNAAKEISEMLDSSIAKVENIVRESKAKVESLVESGKQKVEVGVEVAKQCSTVLDEIVSNVSHVSGLSQEISQASREQSQGVGEINKAMAQLDTVTQQNSSTSEETASAAEELSNQAVSLKSSVDELVIVIQGGVSQKEKPAGSSATGLSRTHSKKTLSLVENKKNVSPLKVTQKQPPVTQAETSETKAPREIRMASGDSFTPSRDSDGFDE